LSLTGALLENLFTNCDVAKKDRFLDYPAILSHMAEKYQELNRFSFRRLLELVCQSLNLNIPSEELKMVVRIRNKLVHTARFFEIAETEGSWENACQNKSLRCAALKAGQMFRLLRGCHFHCRRESLMLVHSL
jgi:hypothetical protein